LSVLNIHHVSAGLVIFRQQKNTIVERIIAKLNSIKRRNEISLLHKW